MNNALSLVVVLPGWYLSAACYPFAAGVLTFIPAFGTLCLLTGVVIGLARRDPRLLLFLASFILCEIFVAVAGGLRGQVRDHRANTILITFITAQTLLSGYFVYRLRKSLVPACALAVFSLSYTLFAAFVSAMSFSDNWL